MLDPVLFPEFAVLVAAGAHVGDLSGAAIEVLDQPIGLQAWPVGQVPQGGAMAEARRAESDLVMPAQIVQLRHQA